MFNQYISVTSLIQLARTSQVPSHQGREVKRAVSKTLLKVYPVKPQCLFPAIVTYLVRITPP